jgi:hypothetical protein
MSETNGTPAASPVTTDRPRCPRKNGLTYDARELCWALGVSIRQLRRKAYLIPGRLKLTGRPLWSRCVVDKWVADGCKPKV